MKSLLTCFLFCLSLIANAEVYEHRYFNANFPDTESGHFEIKKKNNIENINYENDSITLKLAFFPVSICLTDPSWIVNRMGYDSCEEQNVSEATVCGRRVVKLSPSLRCSGPNQTYTNIYLLSNGEITLAFGETSYDNSVSWWNENIDLKIEDMSSRTLSERTSDLEKFLNMAMECDGSEISIIQDGEHVKIDLYDTSKALNLHRNTDAKHYVKVLVKKFSVFEEYAALGYPISIKIRDREGDVVCDSTFSHEEYSLWSDEASLSDSNSEAANEDNVANEREPIIMIEPGMILSASLLMEEDPDWRKRRI